MFSGLRSRYATSIFCRYSKARTTWCINAVLEMTVSRSSKLNVNWILGNTKTVEKVWHLRSFKWHLFRCMWQFPAPFLDASSHLYKRFCPSVRPSVTPPWKSQFLALFNCEDIIYQVIRIIWEPYSILCLHLSVRPSLAPNSIYADTVRTHRCMIGLVKC